MVVICNLYNYILHVNKTYSQYYYTYHHLYPNVDMGYYSSGNNPHILC